MLVRLRRKETNLGQNVSEAMIYQFCKIADLENPSKSSLILSILVSFVFL